MTGRLHQVRFHAALTGATVQAAPRPDQRTVGSNAVAAPVQSPEVDVGALLNELFEQLADLETRRLEIAGELHSLAVDLAIAVSEKILLQKLDTDAFPVAEIVQSILEQTQWTEPAKVQLHPTDLQLLQNQLADQSDSRLTSCRLVAEPGFARGRCHVSIGEQGFFYDVNLQLAEIRQRLLEKLNEAEMERRDPRTSDSELRRFPERRAIG